MTAEGGPLTRAKNRVHDFVAALAEGQGIDPNKMLFKWDIHHGLPLPEQGIEVNQTICVLKIYLGRKSQTLTFSGPSLSRSHQNPERFLSEHKDQIVAALRALKRTKKTGPPQHTSGAT